MSKSVFVLVEGFSTAERHALGSMFDLSRERETVYWAWRPGASRPPSLLLVDASLPDVVDDAQGHLAAHPQLLSLWVLGPDQDESALSQTAVDIIRRPIDWQHLLGVMDAIFVEHPSRPVPLDLDLDEADSQPLVPLDEVQDSLDCVLLIDPSPERSLLVRAWLSSQNFNRLDDVADPQTGFSNINTQHYAVVLVSTALPDAQVWELVAHARNRMCEVFLLSRQSDWRLRLRAWRSGVRAILTEPLDLSEVTQSLWAARKQREISGVAGY